MAHADVIVGHADVIVDQVNVDLVNVDVSMGQADVSTAEPLNDVMLTSACHVVRPEAATCH